MSSTVEELDENFIVDPVEDFLKDKNVCVKFYYRARSWQAMIIWMGLVILSFSTFGYFVAEFFRKRGNNEYLFWVSLSLLMIVHILPSLYVAIKLAEKEEFMEDLVGGTFRRDQQRRRPYTLIEEGGEIQTDADLQNLSARRDSTSPPLGGKRILIPVVSEAKDSNKGIHGLIIHVHEPPKSSLGESPDSPEITGQVQETSSLKKQYSLAESAVKSIEVPSEDTLPRDSKSLATDDSHPEEEAIANQ